MSLKIGEMKKLLELGNKYSVESIKVGEFEVHFKGGRREARKPKSPVMDSSEPLTPTSMPIGIDKGLPTDDEMLFYSTPTFPDIKSKPPEEP